MNPDAGPAHVHMLSLDTSCLIGVLFFPPGLHRYSKVVQEDDEMILDITVSLAMFRNN